MRSRGLARAADVDSGVISALREWVNTHFGIAFHPEQEQHLRDCVETLCNEVRLDPQTLLGEVRGGRRTLTLKLAEAVSTNYTYFFREPQMFEFFQRSILPVVRGELRVWSAATSGGDEAYSIAIACREHFGDSMRAPVRILGTDISARQIRLAEEGIYPRQHLESLAPERVERYFRPAGLNQYAVRPEVKELCTFRRLNLTHFPWPFEQRFHVIFLRNVLYYFDKATCEAVLEACFQAAEPGAWLITSVTEPLVDVSTRWTPLSVGLFRRGPG